MPIHRRALFGKLNLTLFRAIESATVFAKLRGNPYVELIHWLHQIWQLPDSDVQRIGRHFGIESSVVERDFSVALNALPAGASAISDFSHHIEVVIQRAWVLCTIGHADSAVRGAWLVAALVELPELRRILLDISLEFRKLPPEGLDDLLLAIVADSPEGREGAHDGSGLVGTMPGAASGALVDAGDGKSALAKYCVDLTELARSGQIDPVVGRGHEIRTMIDILLRRRQNNPLLTGEAGVGKTAVVEGLALAVAHGDVPPALLSVRLLSLDVGALLAGASMRGEFESRLKGVLEEAGKSVSPVILFVDEIHTLVGAGGQAGTGDAANLLKPALARGTLRTIGATTWSEFKRHVEKDPALTRRFQVLQVSEPEEMAAVQMVRGLVRALAEHHRVAVLDEAVRAAVMLSHRYIPARQLPDKAISLLDTACARVAMSLHAPPAAVEHLRQQAAALNTELELLDQERVIVHGSEARAERENDARSQLDAVQLARTEQELRWQGELALVQRIQALRAEQMEGVPGPSASPELRALEAELADLQGDVPLIFPQVNEAVVAAVLADWTGIPVGRMVTNEVAAVTLLQATLDRRVIGQVAALRAIVERVQTARARLTDPNKPIGVFLLVGPSGVGKTETALALAESMYGGEHNLITVNMSEYQEAHTVSTLKGAPPGYVGYGEGGVLTEAVRRRPYSVILLDEIEKAHPDVHEVFYQVFDKGWMEDGEGRHIDFKNTLILLTSNVGSDLISRLCDGPLPVPVPEVLREALLPDLRRVFPAALMGRLTIVPYLPLGEAVLGDIVRLQLDRVVARMQEQHGIELICGDDVQRHIVQRCGTHETGARLLAGFIEQHLLPSLAGIWLQSLQEGETVRSVAVSVAGSDTATVPTTTAGGLAYHSR